MFIGICDDDLVQVDFLRSHVELWATSRSMSVRISTFDSAESFLFNYDIDKSIDLLLLDIQMAKMDGVKLAKQIRKFNKSLQIIFITGYTDYILDGYDVDALHYLLKPVDVPKLYAALDKALEKIAFLERFLMISSAGESFKLPLSSIRYIEVLHNHTSVVADEVYTVKLPLKEIERSLDDSFFRCGRSFIVNLRFVHKSSKSDVTLRDGSVIPLSRGLYNDLNRALIERI